MRICSLLPSATEIAFALGLGDAVVGVTHECDYPPQAQRKPKVVSSAIDSHSSPSGEIDRAVSQHVRAKTSIYTLDRSRFRELDPDVILTQALCDVCAVDYQEVLDAVRALPRQPKIVSLTPNSLSDVLADIERVGEATGRQKQAETLLQELRQRVDKVRERASRSPLRPRVACLEWIDPTYIAGHWVPEMVELAGGEDVLGKKGLPSEKIAWKDVLEFAPEVVVVMPCGYAVEKTLKESHLLKRLERWSELPAVQQGRVFAVNANAYFSRSGPRLVDGLEILAQVIHPEIFSWETPSEGAQKIT